MSNMLQPVLFPSPSVVEVALYGAVEVALPLRFRLSMYQLSLLMCGTYRQSPHGLFQVPMALVQLPSMYQRIVIDVWCV